MVTPTTVFEGLTEYFQDRTVKFQKLIQEEHAIVGQRNFTGSRNRTASDQPGTTDGVVRGSEGAVGQKRLIPFEC